MTDDTGTSGVSGESVLAVAFDARAR